MNRDRFGSVIGLSDSETNLIMLSRDSADYIVSMGVVAESGTEAATYKNRVDGLRESASYKTLSAAIDFDYDAVGNLESIKFTNSEGKIWRDEYVSGPGNRVEMIVGQTGSDVSFQYDASGAPVRVEQEEKQATFEYDAIGRLVGASVDGTDFSIEYGPLDKGVVEAADARSVLTHVNQPTASAVFNNIDNIVSNRLVGSPYGPIQFDANSARFVLGENLVIAPDAEILSGLERRMFANAEGNIDILPLGFDKPSNSLFIPPEYYSVNCYICINSVNDVTIRVENSTSPTNIDGGEVVVFDVDVSGWCTWLGEGAPGVATFDHLFYFGDGNAQWKSKAINGDTTFTHQYFSAGTKLAISNVDCSCSSLFGDSDTHTVVVNIDPPPQVSIEYSMFIPLDHVRLPTWMQLPPVKFFEGDNKLIHSPAQPGFRIQQQILWTSSTNQLASAGLSGVTKSYLPSVNLTTSGNCVRKNCTQCAKYLGVEDFVYQGKCKTGSHIEASTASGMSTIVASIVSQTSDSVTIRFSGEPYNAIAFGASVFGDIDWSHDLTIDWSVYPVTWELDYQHDGFPYHHVDLNGLVIYTFDPVTNGQTPLSLNGVGSGEWSGVINGVF